MISKFIRPNDWKATDFTLEQVAAAELQPAIGALKGQVIVRHSKHVVDEIQEFLYTSVCRVAGPVGLPLPRFRRALRGAVRGY